MLESKITKVDVRALLVPMVQQARREKKWLRCSYQNLWFSPNELEAHNKDGRFLWGPVNWELRDPADHVEALRREVLRKTDELRAVEKRVRLQ